MSEFEIKTPEQAGQEQADRIHYSHMKDKDDRTFHAEKKALLRRTICAAVLGMILLYFLLPVSHVRGIRIEGTSSLSDAYIQELSHITENSRFYFVFPGAAENRVEADPLVEHCEITMNRDQTVTIAVTEKKVLGYYYDDEASLLLADGSTAELKSEYLDVIASVPYISGFDEDQLKKLAKYLGKVDQEVISQMSEIDKYSLSYDSNSVRILMRTGGYYISSFNAVDKVSYYRQMYDNQTNKDFCIFGSSSSSVAYSAACPWNEEQEEYWTDANGEYILNSSGARVVKHYYTDESGNKVTDASGNYIPIPIDENGNEVKDGDFLEHYKAGYYATGTLVLPDDGTESEGTESTDNG